MDRRIPALVFLSVLAAWGCCNPGERVYCTSHFNRNIGSSCCEAVRTCTDMKQWGECKCVLPCDALDVSSDWGVPDGPVPEVTEPAGDVPDEEVEDGGRDSETLAG